MNQFSVHFVSLVGWIVSTLLAGATVGSFTGGSLADKFGRTKTFILDAIPLAVGAFLWYILLHGAHDFFDNIWGLIGKTMPKPSSHFQRHSPKYRDNDNRPVTCWHWDWCFFCYCATLHLRGTNVITFKLLFYIGVFHIPNPPRLLLLPDLAD